MAKFDHTHAWYLAKRLASISLFLPMVISPAFADVALEVTVPNDARVMTAVEIHKLYRNKSWQWKNGAGRFQDTDRLFFAWSDNSKARSWAEGKWLITNTGRMCLNTTWHTNDGAYPDKVCFMHKIHSDTVYQKREPDGAWHVLRYGQPQKDKENEDSELVAIDLVSDRLADLKNDKTSTMISNE